MRNRSGYERRPYGAEPRLFKWHPYESDPVDCVVEVNRESSRNGEMVETHLLFATLVLPYAILLFMACARRIRA